MQLEKSGNDIVAPGEYYHICSRGVMKRQIFFDNRDYARFLFMILFFQSPIAFDNLGRFVSNYPSDINFGLAAETIITIVRKRIVELAAFAVMPNHIHLLIKEMDEKGIATYAKRFIGGYAKYFNTKYKQTGHVFESKYRRVHIKDNDQLLYVSAYIHRNCTEVKGWQRREVQYPWSSYQDYANRCRWPKLLDTTLISEQFKNGKEYADWVETSGAKDYLFDPLLDV